MVCSVEFFFPFSGHQYLSDMGILYCDISENNIALGRHPHGERGYLIDFDMAAPGPFTDSDTEPLDAFDPNDMDAAYAFAMRPPPLTDEGKSTKVDRMEVTPYMSINALKRGTRTHYDDIESFFYVLLLFFFSYARPLPMEDLLEADAQGFTQAAGSGPLPHVRRWPDVYAPWDGGDFSSVARDKGGLLGSEDCHIDLVRSRDFQDCLN
ncbi:hypothetical protein HYDPIDRAFT_39438 [Hydnomerulius pinastri MD-312]|nr:hypothetical protein HYDPIDRAFT_39438 [Hydnomerulius pinastri MD-312]